MTCPTSAAAGVLNPGEVQSWGNDQFWILPNVSLQIWARNFYILYTYWPESVARIYDIDIYFVPPETRPSASPRSWW